MDQATTTLLNLLRLTSNATDRQSSLAVVPVEDVIEQLFAALLPAEESARIGRALADVVNERSNVCEGLTTAIESIRRIEADTAARDAWHMRLDAFCHALDEVMALEAVLRSDAVRHAEIQIDNAQVFRLIQRLVIEPKPDECEVVVVGAIPRNDEYVQVPWRNTYLVERVPIAYRGATPYPYLSPTTPSMAERAPFAPRRTHWLQRADAEHDLELFNMRSVRLGVVRTSVVTLPYEIVGQHARLTLRETPDIQLVMTEISDKDEQPLARALRVVTAPSWAL